MKKIKIIIYILFSSYYSFGQIDCDNITARSFLATISDTSISSWPLPSSIPFVEEVFILDNSSLLVRRFYIPTGGYGLQTITFGDICTGSPSIHRDTFTGNLYKGELCGGGGTWALTTISSEGGCIPHQSVPTLSQWGLITLGLLLLIFGAVAQGYVRVLPR